LLKARAAQEIIESEEALRKLQSWPPKTFLQTPHYDQASRGQILRLLRLSNGSVVTMYVVGCEMGLDYVCRKEPETIRLNGVHDLAT